MEETEMLSLRELDERMTRLEGMVTRLKERLAALDGGKQVEKERGYTHCSQCGGNYYRCGCH